MLRSKTTVAYDITDTVNLQYRHEGYEIFKVRANVNYIGCEKAEDKSFLVFGEYTLFLLLKSLDKKSDYSIKAIRCPFIKTVSISDRLLAFSDSSKLQVSLGDPPECNLEDMDIKPVNKNALCRINLSYRVEFWESGEGQNTDLSNRPADKESTDSESSDSGSVKVWRVDSSKKHTIEQLLGIDRDTLMQFNKSHTQE